MPLATQMRMAVMYVLGLIVISGCVQGVAVAQVPSASFLAAALEHMEYLGNGTLRMEGVYRDLAEDTVMYEFRYVRSPEILYLRREDKNSVSIMSHDRIQERFRSILTMTATGEVRAVEQYGVSGTDLNTQVIPDIPNYKALGGSVTDAIRRGTVQEAMEDVAGEMCYRVDVTGGPSGPTHGTFWLDPTLGFSIRRILLVWPGNASSKEIVFSDYHEAGPELWFPRNVRMTTSTTVVPPGFQGDLFRVEQEVMLTAVEVGMEVTETQFDVKVPPGGASITTPTGTTVYTYGEAGPTEGDGDGAKGGEAATDEDEDGGMQ